MESRLRTAADMAVTVVGIIVADTITAVATIMEAGTIEAGIIIEVAGTLVTADIMEDMESVSAMEDTATMGMATTDTDRITILSPFTLSPRI